MLPVNFSSPLNFFSFLTFLSTFYLSILGRFLCSCIAWRSLCEASKGSHFASLANAASRSTRRCFCTAHLRTRRTNRIRWRRRRRNREERIDFFFWWWNLFLFLFWCGVLHVGRGTCGGKTPYESWWRHRRTSLDIERERGRRKKKKKKSTKFFSFVLGSGSWAADSALRHCGWRRTCWKADTVWSRVCALYNTRSKRGGYEEQREEGEKGRGVQQEEEKRKSTFEWENVEERRRRREAEKKRKERKAQKGELKRSSSKEAEETKEEVTYLFCERGNACKREGHCTL